MDEKFFIEIACQQKCHGESRVSGDVFMSKKIKEEGRILAVLSDGIGHGIKANLLATLTTTIAANFAGENRTLERFAEVIMKTLPYDQEKQMNFSTFTIVEIDAEGEVLILEYENPRTMILRGSHLFEPQWNCVILGKDRNQHREVLTARFRPVKEDRIVFCSDGVTQSGLGSEKFMLGWGLENLQRYLLETVREESNISAAKLSEKVINKANQNDNFYPKDDISCGVIYFREPRKLVIFTGPPMDNSLDSEFTGLLRDFKGTKIICGATTADMVAREWHEQITDSGDFADPDLPPVSYMKGVDLITEGILTLSKVSELLKKWNQNMMHGKGPADLIIRFLLESDEIQFLVGTNINIAHQDPTLPVELELRRTVVHRIARILEEKFLKEVSLKFF